MEHPSVVTATISVSKVMPYSMSLLEIVSEHLSAEKHPRILTNPNSQITNPIDIDI